MYACQNIQLLIGDFSGSKNLYKTAHIYFIESKPLLILSSSPKLKIHTHTHTECSQSLFSKLGSSSVARSKFLAFQHCTVYSHVVWWNLSHFTSLYEPKNKYYYCRKLVEANVCMYFCGAFKEFEPGVILTDDILTTLQ